MPYSIPCSLLVARTCRNRDRSDPKASSSQGCRGEASLTPADSDYLAGLTGQAEEKCRAGDCATASSGSFPLDIADLSADEEARPSPNTVLAGLSLAAVGVVRGDIGTSPVYTFGSASIPSMDCRCRLGTLWRVGVE
jgi:hypothetical protein